MPQRWNMSTLRALTEHALTAAPYEGVESARVRSVPDTRTIRYYTTLGIIDRPSELRGRTAYYERRHVLQLVAIKRLQANGEKLSKIQTELAGATDRQLGKVAALPKGFWEDERTLAILAGKAPINRSKASQPTPPSAPTTPSSIAPTVDSPDRSKTAFWETPVAAPNEPTLVIKLPLGRHVQLEFTDVPPERMESLMLELQPAVQHLADELRRVGLEP